MENYIIFFEWATGELTDISHNYQSKGLRKLRLIDYQRGLKLGVSKDGHNPKIVQVTEYE